MISSNTRQELNVFLGLGLFATILLFFVSSDSYTHDLYNKVDSAWFYMCGKAWFEGLTPYVDFADSKGPLLWLIYGVGYLLSPYNYLGVFWIACLWYSFILYFTYKTAQIFLRDTRQSIISAVLMSCCYLHTWYHNEVRAEDFALLFMVISLYAVCRMLYGEPLNKRVRNGLMFALGASCSALFLIKFNLALMQFGFILAAIYYTIHKRSGIIPFLWIIAGGITVLAPFAIYFVAKGNLVPFLQEYIFNTTQTVQTVSGGSIFSKILYAVLDCFLVRSYSYQATIIAFSVLGAVCLGNRLEKYKWAPLLGVCYVFAVNFIHSSYYAYAICTFCPIFLVIWLINEVELFTKTLPSIIIIGGAFMLCIIQTNLFVDYNGFYRPTFWRDKVEQKAFYDMNYIIEQVERPTLLNAACYEYGVGIMSQTLPACKYWALQNGSTQQMRDDQRQCIQTQKADFVYVHLLDGLKQIELTVPDILDAGYNECYRWIDGSEQEHILFTKHQVQLPPDDLDITIKDVLTKRTDFDWITK